MKRLSFSLTAIVTISFLCVFLSGCGAGNEQGTQSHTISYADGSKYAGEFKDGLFDGQGTLTYPDGGRYVGQFKEGMRDGNGKMTYPDGRVEEGLWKQDKLVGAGLSTQPPGISAQSGRSTKIYTEAYPDGSKYVGEMKDGLFDGQGTLTWSDGRQYVGQFHQGQLNGTGKMTYPNGKVEEGLWKDDKFMGASTSP